MRQKVGYDRIRFAGWHCLALGFVVVNAAAWENPSR